MAPKIKAEFPPPLVDDFFFLLTRASEQVVDATDRFSLISNSDIIISASFWCWRAEESGTKSDWRTPLAFRKQNGRLIDHLELNGCVTRQQNEDDRREYRLALTEKGHKQIKHIRTLLAEHKPPYVEELAQTETDPEIVGEPEGEL